MQAEKEREADAKRSRRHAVGCREAGRTDAKMGRVGLLRSKVESFSDFDGDSSASVEVLAVVVHG